MPESLRSKVFIPLIVLMLMLVSYLYFYWMPRAIANMERQCRDATELHLESVVEGIVPLILGRELDTIYANLNALLKKNRDWSVLRLSDSEGRQIYPLENMPPSSAGRVSGNVHIIEMPVNYLDAKLGVLSVKVDFTPHLQELKQDFQNAVSAMLLMIAIMLVSIGVVLEKRVVQPVESLGLAARRLAQGSFADPDLTAGEDELGRLARSFMLMRENLAASYNLLSLSEQKNRVITTTAHDAIVMMDEGGRVSFWNPAAENIFGYSAAEALGSDMHRLISPDSYRAEYERGLMDFAGTGEGPAVGKTTELVARRKDGVEFPVELSLSAIQMQGNWHAVGIVRDITQRKMAEKNMLATLEEKGVLLREIHHRVKNNLQVIMSMLDLQLRYMAGKQPENIFMDIKTRIRSMSLVHEKLYRSQDLSMVDFRDYIVSLVSNLYRFYDASPDRIRLDLSVEDTLFGIDTAIPCGLIVNELITNSLKYAFPDGREGCLEITLHKTGVSDSGGGIYELVVRDNGIGIPEGLDIRETRTLGLYLVTTLVEHQLQGTIDLNRTSGTEFRIRFCEMRYKRRV